MCSPAVPSTPKSLLPDPNVASPKPSLVVLPPTPMLPLHPVGRTCPGRDALRLWWNWPQLAVLTPACSLRRVLFQTSQGSFTAQTAACRLEGRLKRTCVWRVSCLSSLCRPGGSLRIPICHRHRGRIPSPSVDSFYFYGKCLHWMSCSAAGKGSLPLFPARLSDLPFASLLFSWSFSGRPSELKCLGSFVCVVCLWFIYFFINLSPLAMTET